MRRRHTTLAAAAVLACLAAACSDSDPPAERAEGARRAAPPPGDVAPPRPFVAPPGFPLPFSTSVPGALRVETLREGAGDGVRFVSYAGGERRDSAFVYLYVHPPSTPEAAAREIVRTAAERVRVPGDRTELDPVHRRPWAVVEYRIRSRGTVRPGVAGWVALGRKGDRWFHLIVQHPVGMESAFVPRAERLLSTWRWADGSGLASTAAPPRS
ncbi:MAG: hypothetical protein AB1941_21685 [Gemmatimonadota bacterium]